MTVANKTTTSPKQASKSLNLLLQTIADQAPFPTPLKRTNLTEAWFSDMLAWLLDVKGNHGYGTAFADRFLVRVARIRTQGHKTEQFTYTHRSKHLRFGRKGIPGTPCTRFRLGNSSVFREFYLANGAGKSVEGGAALCDVVFLDLDPRDGIFVTIENKLFTTNRHNQLESYFKLVETKFARASVLEYVYLTLTGEPPQDHGELPDRVRKAWVRMSWLGDVRAVLKEMPASDNRQVKELEQILDWLSSALRTVSKPKFASTVNGLLTSLVSAATECIFDELARLNEGARGQWQIVREGRHATRIVHSSKPTVPLFVGVMPNLSIAVFCRRRQRNPYDKLLIPFGSNPDQIFNLMDFAARDIYPLHFGSSSGLYLGLHRRLTGTEVAARKDSRHLFDFVHRNRHEIQLLAVLTTLSRKTAGAEEWEPDPPYSGSSNT